MGGTINNTTPNVDNSTNSIDEFDSYFRDLEDGDAMDNIAATNLDLDLDNDFLDVYQMTPRQRIILNLKKSAYNLLNRFYSLPLWQRIILVILGIIQLILMILLLVFHNKILNKLVDVSNELSEKKSTQPILLLLLFIVAFPPLIGYSFLSTATGLLYGVTFHGWILLSFGTVCGSVASFTAFKTILHSRAEKLVHANRRFEALASILQENESYWMLSLLRLCPFPYSFTNGAIAGIYGISIRNFTIANLITTPKVLIYLFIGSRIKSMGESDSTSSRLFDFLSIVITMLVFMLTAWLLYYKTKKRYLELRNFDGQHQRSTTTTTTTTSIVASDPSFET
ncbi:Tvp38p NDAI_0E04980 [Naumovozyma dairenensis CBS 421]|uniref:Golgi apparatus membrane protein TVP38 n=1 Tax=Naumovozyma dairenensis (strain ATCC 10597 / BCRC 20456 / CBS 421 / NBRC 0211 / NRRL Y-12639) TaxID=1071378 RepID=G0WAP2_NAUDC|nr:hypothetical protein NDAI_0E04980 [Naumovozyma dairenensis CBS 421]CCD25315.1 hypothetical protein NDAI_0E04980 [Naumovozyma dairenensis CBS 421]